VSNRLRGLLLLVLVPLALLVPSAGAVPTGLYLSEYIEGSSNNKALEIHNNTGSPVNLLSAGYSVQMFFNGSAAAGLTINLDGTVAAGDVFVLAQSSASAAILAQADQTNGAGWFNGDDAVVLRQGTTVVDSIGQAGFDPGSEWGTGLASTADNTLRRKPTVAAGDMIANDVFDPAAEWDGFATDTFDGLGCSGTSPCNDTAPAVSSTAPANGATDVAAGTNVSITFSEAVNVAGSWFTISCTASGAHSAAVSGGPTTFTLDPDVSFTFGESCTVTVVGPQVTDQDANDPPNAMAADHAFTFGVGNPCAASFTPIHQIQGSGPTAAITGNVTTQGVVVGDFEGPIASGLQGFFLQDATGDGNAATSDGIFVFTGDPSVDVSRGQVVRVTGFARERFNQTALNGANSNNAAVPAANIVPCGTGSVTPTQVSLPAPAPTSQPTALEQYEGMLVRMPQALVISEYFNYDRFGELVLGLPLPGETRHFTPTSIVEPGAPHVERFNQYLARRITLDDGLGSQNPGFTRHPNGAGFSLSNSFRGGDTVANTLGVMSWDFNLWRIQPTGPATYTPVNVRPGPLESVEGIRVATMNTLNFFLTLDIEPNAPSGQPPLPGDNACGPLQNVECRGADSNQPTEFDRQRTKLLQALSGLGADVIGLNELENTTGVDPLSDPNGIVPGLNAMLGAGAYDAIDTGTIGGDAIKVGLIYKPGVVTPVGGFKLLTSSVDPRFIDTLSRPVLAQTFQVNATGARFTVAVNHLKSKGSACTGDPDTGDGQGNCNLTRKAAAEALVDWLATDPTGSDDPDFLIMGDLNAYAKEDPIDSVLRGADDVLGTGDDYTNLVQKYEGQFAYSFVFDGMAGYLDHGLANSAVVDQVLGATEWHINADEPDLVDYDTSFKSATQDTFFEPNQFRSADHDPLVVTLCADLTACAIDRIEAIVDDIEAMLASANQRLREKLETVLDELEQALQRLAGPQANRTGAAGDVEVAVGEVQAAIRQGLVGAAPGNALLDRLARAVRLLAVDAIEEAKAREGNATEIDEAEKDLSKGDARRLAARFTNAVSSYRDAIAKAEGA
jgi:predicted extracellular nuclease